MLAVFIVERRHRPAGRPISSRTTSISPARSKSQLLSLISEGVFSKFPDLKIRVHRVGFLLAAGLHVAFEQDLAWRARGNTVGQARACETSSVIISG